MTISSNGPAVVTGAVSDVGAIRPQGAADRTSCGAAAVDATAKTTPPPTGATAPTAAIEVASSVLAGGTAPIDQGRVARIRNTIETNSCPPVPSKIGDAMIAAGMLRRIPK